MHPFSATILTMPILRNAIACRCDFHGREDWANARSEPILVGWPSGCVVEYETFVLADASGDDTLKWVAALLARLEVHHPDHANVILL